MARIIAALIGGVLLGILLMLAADRFGPSSNQAPDVIVRDIADVPKMTQAVAEKHRAERYAGLSTVEEVMALPTEFVRSEAMYALAGRSDSADVQNLIFEANRIADDVERASLLNVLFFRLAEVDPQSALAHARSNYFNGVKSIEQTVWRAWARRDLGDALFAAKTQTSVAHQNFAAQSLYAAFGYMGNETTDRIEAELGIEPDRSSRARYLYQLADRSPAEAIRFINGLERGTEEREYVSWLANYLSLRDPSAALRYADLFRVASNGESFSSIIKRNIARENPRATIERLLASGNSGRSSREYHSAISALASTDLDAAQRYFEQARSNDHRQLLGPAIASEMAKKDPLEALIWARANESSPLPRLQMTVIDQIARTDPQLALTEALNTPNAKMRSMMVSSVLQRIAQENPADAITYLDQIQDQTQKLEASENIVFLWISRDFEAATDWILSQDKHTAEQMIQKAGRNLLHGEIDAAIRLLPKMDAQNQQSMRMQIAEKLGSSRSPGEAQSFVQQFEGQPGYDQLQLSLISGMAKSDVLMAKQLADQLTNSNARDKAYVQLITQRTKTDPTEAMHWLSNVKDERSRSLATSQIATQWYERDPAAATHWVSNLQAGPSRDDTIVRMAYQWREPTPEHEKLIASIEDRDKRGKAKIRQIYNILRTNPAKARELLADEDIPSDQRQRAETTIRRYDSGF